MNSRDDDDNSMPSYKNALAIHERNKVSLSFARNITLEMKGLIPKHIYDRMSSAILRQERSAKKFEKTLNSDAEKFWNNKSVEFRDEFTHYYNSCVAQEIATQEAYVELCNLREVILTHAKPPLLSELITRLVVNRRQADRVIDSRSEAYAKNVIKHGRSRATAYHWADTIKSCWPAVKRIVPYAVVGEWFRRYFGS